MWPPDASGCHGAARRLLLVAPLRHDAPMDEHSGGRAGAPPASAPAARTIPAAAASPSTSLVEVLAFLSELAVFGLLAVSAWNLSDVFALQLVLAVLLPVAVITLWGLLLAPRSPRRLLQPGRFAVQLVVFCTSGALALAAGFTTAGRLVPAAAGLVFLLVLVLDRGSPRRP